MSQFSSPANPARSALWLWGFWIYFGTAVAVFVFSLYTPSPVDRILRGVVGALLLVGGPHQLRVVAYKCATRPPYSTYGPDSYAIQRQTGRSAMVLGVVFIAGAVVGL